MKHDVHSLCGYIKGRFGEFWIDDEYSRNGLQVDANPNVETEVRCVAFAVDACLETIEKAAEAKAQMLVVHHGISWGHGFARIDGITAGRVAALIRNGVSLFGCHLPLDAHPVFGNNAVIARRLGLKVSDWAFESNGLKLGAVCRFDSPVPFTELAARAKETISHGTVAYDNSEGTIYSLGIVSGGGDFAIHECAERGIDCLLTGEFRHQFFHDAAELGVSVLACGHYDSEHTGIQELMKIIGDDCNVETVFIESPTGL